MKRLTAAFGLLFCCLPSVAQALFGTGPGDVLTHGMITAAAANGTLNPRGTWAAYTAYAVGDSFIFNGTPYVVATAFTSGSTFNATNLIQGVTTNSTIAAVAAQNEASAVSPKNLSNGIQCDALLEFTTTAGNTFSQYGSSNGANNSQLRSVQMDPNTPGTDNGAIVSAISTALLNPIAEPFMPSIEGSVQLGGQNTLRLPNGCIFMSSQPLVLPSGIDVEGNNTYFVYTGTGSAIQDISLDTRMIHNRAKTKIQGLNIVYAGTPWTDATAAFAGIYISGSNELTLRDDNIYNFPTGFALNNVEYAHLENLNGGFNRVGIEVWGPASGQASLDNREYNLKMRLNKVGFWIHTGSANKFIGGTASYNFIQPILIGGLLPPYVSGATATGGTCTASANIPLTVTDSAGGGVGSAAAHLIYATNSAGTGGTVYQTYGGTYTSSTTPSTLTVTAPSTGTNSCSAQPTFAASVYAMPSTYAMVPSTLSLSVPQVGGGYNTFSNFDIESTGTGSSSSIASRAGSGRVIYGDANAGLNKFEDIDFLIDTGLTHDTAIEMHGQGNYIAHNTGTLGNGDPWNGSVCPYLSGAAGSIVVPTPGVDEDTDSTPVCDITGTNWTPINGSNAGGGVFGQSNYSTYAKPTVSTRYGSTLPSFSLNFQSNNGTGTAATANLIGVPSSSGIPNFAECKGSWVSTDGNGGVSYTRTYNATAVCNVRDGIGTVALYKSNGAIFGSEVWSGAPMSAGAMFPTDTGAVPTAGATCYNGTIPSAPQFHLYNTSGTLSGWSCSGNPGTWQKLF